VVGWSGPRPMERVVAGGPRDRAYLDGVAEFAAARSLRSFSARQGGLAPVCTGKPGASRAARAGPRGSPMTIIQQGDAENKGATALIFSSRHHSGQWRRRWAPSSNGLITPGRPRSSPTGTPPRSMFSGHPRRDELRDMISWVRPAQVADPGFHGRGVASVRACKNWRGRAGVPKVLICRNGGIWSKLGPGRIPVLSSNYCLPGRLSIKDGRDPGRIPSSRGLVGRTAAGWPSPALRLRGHPRMEPKKVSWADEPRG